MLRLSPSDASIARCKHCGAPASGPCRRCREPLCADCCLLVEGQLETYALCRDCAALTGPSVRWRHAQVVLWLVLPILILILLLVLLQAFFGSSPRP